MEDLMAFVVTALSPLHMLTTRILALIPSILAALVLLLVGSFVGRWLRALAERVLGMTNMDDYSRRMGVAKLLSRLGLGSSPTNVVGFMVYWVIFLAFLVSAANALELTIVSEFLHRIVVFMPKLIAAVLVLGGGLFLGTFVGNIVYRAADANRVKGADALSKVTYGLLVIFSCIMALQCLGIDTSIISNSIQIIIAAIGLGCAIAFGVSFGMAGRETAERWIKDLTPKNVRPGLGDEHYSRIRVAKER